MWCCRNEEKHHNWQLSSEPSTCLVWYVDENSIERLCCPMVTLAALISRIFWPHLWIMGRSCDVPFIFMPVDDWIWRSIGRQVCPIENVYFWKCVTWCGLMRYLEGQGNARENVVKEKDSLFPWRAETLYYKSKVTLPIRVEILQKVCSAAWIRLMKHESELELIYQEGELVRLLIIHSVTPREDFTIQIFKLGDTSAGIVGSRTLN